jgi:hypothetical protein
LPNPVETFGAMPNYRHWKGQQMEMSINKFAIGLGIALVLVGLLVGSAASR